jgi:hypothetical protein
MTKYYFIFPFITSILISLLLAVFATPVSAADFNTFGTVTVTADFNLNGQGENVDTIAFYEAPDPTQSLMFVSSKNVRLVEVWKYPYQSASDQLTPITHSCFDGRDTTTGVNGVIVDQATNLLYVTVVNSPAICVFSIPSLAFQYSITTPATMGWYEPNLALLKLTSGQTRLYSSYDTRVYFHDTATRNYLGQFDPTKGLETVWGDNFYQALYIPDENGRTGVYAYHPDGTPYLKNGTNIFGDSTIFNSDAEGIWVYSCPANGSSDNGTGFIIISDQITSSTTGNDYEFFDRRTWEYLGKLKLRNPSGSFVYNTDGIAITQQASVLYPQGIFTAIHNDTSVTGVSMTKIINAANLTCGTSSSPSPTSGPSPTPSRTPTPAPTLAPGTNIQLTPLADATVKQQSPSSNYGGDSVLITSDYSSTAIQRSYLLFDLSNLAGQTITGASLQFTPTLSRVVDKQIKIASSASWTESTITWDNQPGASSAIVGSISQSLTAGTTATITLNTTTINAYSGTLLSLVIDNYNPNNTLEYGSKESVTGPRLVLTTSSTTLPGDFDQDGDRDIIDVLHQISHYNTTNCTVNLFGTCLINLFDFGGLIRLFLPSQSPTPTPTGTLPSPTPSRTPTPAPINTPTPTPTGTISACRRPYTDTSPWNTPVTNAPIHPNSSNLITSLNGRVLGSNPDQYTYPVYEVTNATPNKSLTITGTFSNVTNNGNTLTRSSGTFQIPIPNGALQSAGDDAQMIIINKDTGDEWGFYEASENTDGSWRATNGYHYNINWSGVMPDGFISRGAGVTYLAGLIRKCEIQRGYIDHAIAFAYNYPCSSSTCAARGEPYYVYPATKSDGKGTYQYDFPEGARLKLDATDTEINTWCGSDNACRVIGRALREYGMITIDNSGSAKIYPEANITANWGTLLTSTTPRNIPLNRFRVISY